MAFLTADQRMNWPIVEDGFESVTQEIKAAIIGSQTVNTGLMNDRRDPVLQKFTEEEIACWRVALAAVLDFAEKN